MDKLKKAITIKVIIVSVLAIAVLLFILTVVMAVCGYKVGESIVEQHVNNMRANSTVINSQLYAVRYRSILDKHMLTKGYVPLERVVFYLQRKHNILDTSTLSYEEWENAYLANVNVQEKQMIPIKTICKNINSDPTFPTFTIVNGTNSDGIAIDVIDLCTVDGIDITTSDDYEEIYYPLLYSFPLKDKFTITSIVFEHRDVDLDLSDKEQQRVNFHSGWDFAVPIGTNFYSICDGTIKSIVNTQVNDLPYNSSGNSTGNYIEVTCNNGFVAQYYHIKYMSTPFGLRQGSSVKKGDLLGKTSTTGLSTGGHLHLGLKDPDGNLLDAMAYIDLNNYDGN